MTERKTIDLAGDGPLLSLCVALYAPFIFLGYGADLDAYRAIEAGRRLMEGQAYRPSRNPGFLLHEISSAVLSEIGGSVLTNGVTMIIAVLTLVGFLALTRRFSVPHGRLLLVFLALHPYFWIAATSSVDHVWAICGLLFGLLLLDRGRFAWAGVVWGFAVGFRLSSLFMVFGLLLAAPTGRDRWRRIASGLIALCIGGACYIPSFIHAGHTLAFLHPHTGPQELWTLEGHLGRFAYKNVSLFLGLPAALFLLAVAPATVRALSKAYRGAERPILALSGVALLVTEALYLAYPLDPSYLLPALPFLLITLGVAWRDRRGWLIAAGSLILSTNLVLVLLARPDVPNRATTAKLGLWVERGTLVQDLAARMKEP